MDAAPPLLQKVGKRVPPAWVQLCFLAVVAGMMVLFVFDPAGHGFYPRCYFKALTGWSCPGCGGLRAVHQLLHGHVAQAFRLNPLFVLATPIFLAWSAHSLWNWRRHRPAIVVSQAWGLGFLVISIGFGILRNLL